MSNYSNDITQIRMGLVNYIGASLMATALPEKAAKQAVVGMIVEEAIALSTDSNDEIDLYSVKPIYRATRNMLKIRLNKLNELPNTEQVSLAKEKTAMMVEELDKLIESIK